MATGPALAHTAASSCEVTRREFVTLLALISSGVMFTVPLNALNTTVAEEAHAVSAQEVSITLRVNGQQQKVSIDPRVTLLDWLREHLELTGTKKGCDHGQCGACTVLANRRRINSCLSLAATHDGDEITTVEGLGQGGELHPVQAAFVEHDGFQCGYCTPGQICSTVALLQEYQHGDASFVTEDLRPAHAIELSPAEIRERMSGNLCRCGAYPGIVAAVQEAHQKGSRKA